MARPNTYDKRNPAKAPSRPRVVILIIAFMGASFMAWLWWNSKRADRDFQHQIEQGQSVLKDVKSFPSEGLAKHLPQGSPVNYGSGPPTTGAHYPTASAPGYYEVAQLPGNLVHALEHGNIVIYYDRPSSEVMQQLEGWAHQFQDPWAGVIVSPLPGIGEAIVLTAWTKELRLEKFEAASAAAFIDRFRGRGPENAVR